MSHPLLEGFEQFRSGYYEDGLSLMHHLVEQGQSPDYFMISCIDSRSNPGTIFNASPGTFFTHNAMGAIVRPYKHGTALAAALQFALEYNNVKEIIVLGHTGCGAIKALVDKVDDAEIYSFIDVAQKGLEKAKACCGESPDYDALIRKTEEQIVLESVENLASYPSVNKALAENRIIIRPWLFDMADGKLLAYDYDLNNFIELE